MEIIISFLSEWGYLALFICMVLENMNVPIPSEIILGFAGFLVSQDIFSFWPTVVIGTAAGIAGSVISYYMGAKGGRDMILKHTAKGGLGAKKMIAAKDWFENYGAIAIFTGRLLPGVRTFISLPAGIAQFPLPEFVLLTVLGTVPWTIFLVYVGSALGHNWTLLLDYKWEIAAVCVAISVVIAGGYYIYHKRKSK
ncbi:DedA family protein [uncultured Dialister sp.]|jgi:membrane protein DedA with SNARE-associated domain|uniref:DedA family protein n=1 Tax=uncultured Dialister sp. TaxID=278064 RepID=UPI00260E4B2B|nr:DedA family protein [uncultured Dialister sp.]